MFPTARNPLKEMYDGVPGTSTSRARTPGYFDGVYQSGTLPTLPPSTSRPGSAKVAAVKREIALGNYELARRQASVAEYNNPLDALQTELAIAAQEKVLQEEEEREARRARRKERKLAKALRRMRLGESGTGHRSRSQSRSRSSRKATPYASEASASECESEDHSPASTRQQSHSHDRQTRHRSRSLDPGAHAPEEDDIAAAARARAQTLHVELETQDLNDRYLPQASTSRLAPNHPSKYALDDHLAQESTLENPEAVKSDDRKSSLSTHPSDKKARHIEYALRSEDCADTPAPSAPVLRLVFPSSEEAILTYSEILRGGPSNSFLNSWKQFPGRLDEGELLTIQMPEGRDASLFKVIHAYLQGKSVIPLSPQLARLLCGSYTPNKSAYKRLYKEAGVYGVKGLMEEIHSFRKHVNGNSASSSDSYKKSSRGNEDRIESESHHAMRAEHNDPESSPTRIVMTGAAMNFMALPNRRKQPTLIYSLVAPLTPSTRMLAKLPTCVLDENSNQVALEGVLSQQECCNVLFDVIYRQSSRHRGGDASASAESMKRHPATLEKVVLALQSSSLDVLPRCICDAFEVHYLEEPNSDGQEPNSFNRQPSQHRDSPSFYLNLSYATVQISIEWAMGLPDSPKVVFEQIHTATRDILYS